MGDKHVQALAVQTVIGREIEPRIAVGRKVEPPESPLAVDDAHSRGGVGVAERLEDPRRLGEGESATRHGHGRASADAVDVLRFARAGVLEGALQGAARARRLDDFVILDQDRRVREVVFVRARRVPARAPRRCAERPRRAQAGDARSTRSLRCMKRRRLLDAGGRHGVGVELQKALDDVLAMLIGRTPSPFELGRERRRDVVEGRATGEGDSVNTGEHFVTAEILGHESSLRCGRLLIPPATPQRGVLAVQRDELVVRAEFGDHAVDDHAYAVGVVGGVETVRDGDHGATREDGAQGALEVARGARIEQRGRLVKHEGVRVAQDQAGEGQLLGLGGGDGIAGRAELGLMPSGRSCTHSSASTASSASSISASLDSGRASARLSRTVPMKMWCSWVTSATWRRRSASGI